MSNILKSLLAGVATLLTKRGHSRTIMAPTVSNKGHIPCPPEQYLRRQRVTKAQRRRRGEMV